MAQIEDNTSIKCSPGDVNYKYYSIPDVAEYFCSYKTDLFRAEEITLSSIRDELKNQPLLEIGIGGGRLVPHLMSISNKYVGVDYSNKMIELCKQKFSGVDLRVCDARDMSCFASDQFAAVIFWGNGIDEVLPSDRKTILQEIRRVLKHNGIIAISSHNFDWKDVARSCAFDGISHSNVSKELDLLRLRIYVYCLLVRSFNWITGKGYAVFPEYERSPRMVIPRCYIKKEAQEQQLFDSGFNQVNIITLNGKQLTPANRRKDFMLFYTARKK